MNFLDNNIIAYTAFDNALKLVGENVKNVSSNNVRYFFQEQKNDNYLSDYVKSATELRKAMANFNNLFEDFLMEIETAEQEQWEIDQQQSEENYYSEVQNEGFNK